MTLTQKDLKQKISKMSNKGIIKVLNRVQKANIDSLKATAQNAEFFKKKFDCELDRYNNIIIRYNPFYEHYKDEDDEFWITKDYVEQEIERDFGYIDEELIQELREETITKIAIFLIKRVQLMDTTVIPVSKNQDLICGRLKATNGLGYHLDKEI